MKVIKSLGCLIKGHNHTFCGFRAVGNELFKRAIFMCDKCGNIKRVSTLSVLGTNRYRVFKSGKQLYIFNIQKGIFVKKSGGGYWLVVNGTKYYVHEGNIWLVTV